MPIQPLFERTYKAAEDLRLKQFFVGAHGDENGELVLCDGDNIPAGVITDAPALGQPSKVGERGVFHIYSGAAVTRLAAVACDATGRVVHATAADVWRVGVALESCLAAGTLIEVMVDPEPLTADTELVAALAAAVGDAADLTTTATDVVGGVNEIKETADAAYVIPLTGIPATDLAVAAQASLLLADSAYQEPAGGIPVADLAVIAETVTVDAATGLGTLALAGFGLLYNVQATLISGPPAAKVRFTKDENSLEVAVVNAAGEAVPCDVINAVVDVMVFNLPEA